MLAVQLRCLYELLDSLDSEWSYACISKTFSAIKTHRLLTEVEKENTDKEGLDGEIGLSLLSSDFGLAKLWWCYKLFSPSSISMLRLVLKFLRPPNMFVVFDRRCENSML